MQVRAHLHKRKLLLERILDSVEPQHKIARLILLNNSLESRCVRGCAEDLIKRQTSEPDHVAESWLCASYLAVSQQLAFTTPAGLLRCPIHPSCSPLLLSRLLLRLRLVLRGFLAAGSCHSTRPADVPAASSASRSVIANATASCFCSGASLAWRLKRCNSCRWSGLRFMRYRNTPSLFSLVFSLFLLRLL